MTPIPFNDSVSQVLTLLGFTCTNHPEEWEDVGGPESGPKMVGHKSFDEWSNGATSLFVEDGNIMEIEKYQSRFPDSGPF